MISLSYKTFRAWLFPDEKRFLHYDFPLQIKKNLELVNNSRIHFSIFDFTSSLTTHQHEQLNLQLALKISQAKIFTLDFRLTIRPNRLDFGLKPTSEVKALIRYRSIPTETILISLLSTWKLITYTKLPYSRAPSPVPLLEQQQDQQPQASGLVGRILGRARPSHPHYSAHPPALLSLYRLHSPAHWGTAFLR